MLSNKAIRNWIQILPFGIIWLLSSVVFLAVEYLATKNVQLDQQVIELDLNTLVFAFISVILVGLAIGSIEVLFFQKLFLKKSFFTKTLIKLIFYGLFLFLIILITYPIASSIELGISLFDQRNWNRYIDFLISDTNLSTQIQLACSLSLSLFYAEISNNVGPRVLINFLLGRYHQPIQEDRVFMFLDMKSSTRIAEELGHIRYFDLLKEYYACFSASIVKYGGQVYEYVGDEIIISWDAGKTSNRNHPITCFFAMKKALNKKRTYFEKKYGTIPQFKAGVHLGSVTVGEIGELKRAIMYTGDVLNTTARIQGLCNEFNVEIIVTEELKTHLNLGLNFDLKALGEKSLRGKQQATKLYTVYEV